MEGIVSGSGTCRNQKNTSNKKARPRRPRTPHSAPRRQRAKREAHHHQQRNPPPPLSSGRRQVSAYFSPRPKHAQVRVRVPIGGRLVSCVVVRALLRGVLRGVGLGARHSPSVQLFDCSAFSSCSFPCLLFVSPTKKKPQWQMTTTERKTEQHSSTPTAGEHPRRGFRFSPRRGVTCRRSRVLLGLVGLSWI